jgi:lambda family phage portal protein
MTMPARRTKAAAIPKAGAAAHHAASVDARDMAGWLPRQYSADAEILPDLRRLVDRASDLDRNSGVARGAVQTIVDNVVGTGLRLSARPDYVALGRTKEWADAWSRVVEAKFHAWYWSTACHAGDTLTGDQLTQQVFRSVLNRGEAIALPLWLPKRGPIATRILTIESDRLSQPGGKPESPTFRGGIEFDLYGTPIAYHFRKAHPGDPYLAGFAPDEWERVPRKTPFGRLRVLHVFDPERPGQSRGKPILSAVLPMFKTLDRYQQAEAQAAVVNALVAMTITTPMDQDNILELFNRDPAAYLKARDEQAVRLKPGGILPLFPGDKAEAFLPARPATAFDAFVTSILRSIAAGLDMPYELLLKDFSRTNYSSARAALLEAWRSFLRRRDWLASAWLDRLYALWFEECANAGTIEAPGYYENRAAYERCRWVGPGRGWIDPVKEATAAKLRMEIGVSTLEDECAEQGKDWREVLEQQAFEKAERDRLGLTPPPPTIDAPGAAAGGEDGSGSGDDDEGGTGGGSSRPRRGSGTNEDTADASDTADA